VKTSLLISLVCHGTVLVVGAYWVRTGHPATEMPRVQVVRHVEPAPLEPLPECDPPAEPPVPKERPLEVPEPEDIEVDPIEDEAWPVEPRCRLRRLICLPSSLRKPAAAAAPEAPPPVRAKPVRKPPVPRRAVVRRGGPSRGPLLVDRSKGPIGYPPAAQRRGLEGRVVLCIDIGVDGAVVGVRVRDSSGHTSLDEAAAAAAHHWRFRPALRNGRPVPGVYTRAIVFRLDP
jgi:protein TonB